MTFSFIAAVFLLLLAIVATIGKIIINRRLKAAASTSPDSLHGDRERHSPGHISSTNTSRELEVASTIGKWAVIALWSLTVLTVLLGSFVIVSTKTIGVVTQFGAPTGTLSNGFHLVPLWANVTEMDAAIQTDSHVRDDGNDATNCTSVRIGNQSTACVDNSVRWRIVPEAGDELYQDYKDFDRVRESLVTRQLTSVLNDSLANYDPLAAIDGAAGATPPQTLAELSIIVTNELKARVGTQIVVESVIIPLIHFDEPTQRKINDYQAEIGNTRIATQRELTAIADARANLALAASVSNDPNVLVNKCFDLLDQLIKANQPIPPGFYCWPGGPPAGQILSPTPR